MKISEILNELDNGPKGRVKTDNIRYGQTRNSTGSPVDHKEVKRELAKFKSERKKAKEEKRPVVKVKSLKPHEIIPAHELENQLARVPDIDSSDMINDIAKKYGAQLATHGYSGYRAASAAGDAFDYHAKKAGYKDFYDYHSDMMKMYDELKLESISVQTKNPHKKGTLKHEIWARARSEDLKSFAKDPHGNKNRSSNDHVGNAKFVKESHEHVYLGAKVQPKHAVNKKKPMTVSKIVSDDTAEVVDEFGNKAKMHFGDLVPHKTFKEGTMKVRDIIESTKGYTHVVRVSHEVSGSSDPDIPDGSRFSVSHHVVAKSGDEAKRKVMKGYAGGSYKNVKVDSVKSLAEAVELNEVTKKKNPCKDGQHEFVKTWRRYWNDDNTFNDVDFQQCKKCGWEKNHVDGPKNACKGYSESVEVYEHKSKTLKEGWNDRIGAVQVHHHGTSGFGVTLRDSKGKVLHTSHHDTVKSARRAAKDFHDATGKTAKFEDHTKD